MKFLMITMMAAVATAMVAPREEEEKEMVTVPIIVDDVENNFLPLFDKAPIECLIWKVKLNPQDKLDKNWLNEHGGESLILTKDNMIIKIGDDTFRPNKNYSMDVFDDDEALKVYNKDKLVFQTDKTNFKNMMSYADNEFSFFFIPITMKFSNCTVREPRANSTDGFHRRQVWSMFR
jgi:hypothetical protein